MNTWVLDIAIARLISANAQASRILSPALPTIRSGAYRETASEANISLGQCID